MLGQLWKQANFKLVPSAIIFITSAAVATHYGKMHNSSVSLKLLSLTGVIFFIIFSIAFLNVTSDVLQKVIAIRRLGIGRAGSVKFIIRVTGYIAIILMTLNLLNIPVGRLLLGGAVVGIIIGVAAQQALGNFFASIVLILSHPFSVGEHVVINSGALGGQYVGVITDIGLTHTSVREEDGQIVLLPNATILSGATIRAKRA